MNSVEQIDTHLLPRCGNSTWLLPRQRCRLPTIGMTGVNLNSGVSGCQGTFSGWATIIWQSMKMSGMSFFTQERMGAPRDRLDEDAEVTVLTHCDVGHEMTVVHRLDELSIEQSSRELPVHDI